MQKCIKAEVQLLVKGGAKYTKGNWGEGSLFVGGFVAICCVLIHWGKFLLNKIPWLCYYPAGGGSVLLDV